MKGQGAPHPFVGIGGAGMRAASPRCWWQSYEVSGSDLHQSAP
jgi:UDP-N-acetylmuramate-alanine ligase